MILLEQILLISILGLIWLAVIVSRKIKRDALLKEAGVATEGISNKSKNRQYWFEEHNTEWSKQFESIKHEIGTVFGEKALSIEHVGSTSIPGMLAKPIIDVLITVQRMDTFTNEKKMMEALGYQWGSNFIAPGTLLFFKENSEGNKTENIHVCETGSPQSLQFIYMRDYFRTHSDITKEYADLKNQLKNQHPDDYAAYRQGKKDFLDRVEQYARNWFREKAQK